MSVLNNSIWNTSEAVVYREICIGKQKDLGKIGDELCMTPVRSVKVWCLIRVWGCWEGFELWPLLGPSGKQRKCLSCCVAHCVFPHRGKLQCLKEGCVLCCSLSMISMTKTELELSKSQGEITCVVLSICPGLHCSSLIQKQLLVKCKGLWFLTVG